MTFASWYEELDRQLSNSDIHLVKALNERYPQPWAVPFFGRLQDANILTVGLNPSFSEFEGARWSGINSATDAVNRLVKYFDNPTAPHRWFHTWEAALSELDASYYGKRSHLAAHIDIWARATDSPSEFPEDQLLECIGTELPCFLSALEHAKKATLILMAGSVTGDYYLNQFLKDYLPADQSELTGSFSSYGQAGPGKTSVHWLRLGSRKWRVLFCSTSPSDDENRSILIQRVREYATAIKKWGVL